MLKISVFKAGKTISAKTIRLMNEKVWVAFCPCQCGGARKIITTEGMETLINNKTLRESLIEEGYVLENLPVERTKHLKFGCKKKFTR